MPIRMEPDPDIQIEERGKSGCYGAVWKGRQVSLGRTVAIKIIHPSMATYIDIVEHAHGLVRAGEHPNVVSLYTVTSLLHPESRGLVDVVVMQWLEGEGLDQRLAKHLFSPAEARAICDGVLSGIAHLHGAGVTHGDLHAGNVMVNGTHARIIDIDYSHADSLRLASTLGREARLAQDIRQLASLIAEVIRKTAVDFEFVNQTIGHLRTANSLDEIRALVAKAFPFDEILSQAITGTGHRMRIASAMTSVRGSMPNADASVRRALHRIAGDLSTFVDADDDSDDRFIDALDQTTSLLFEVCSLFEEIASYQSRDSVLATFKSFSVFHEAIEPRGGRSRTVKEAQLDFYRFHAHELFVSFVSCLLQNDRLELLAEALLQPVVAFSGQGTRLMKVAELSEFVQVIENRNQRRELRRMSLHADILKQRHDLPLIAEYVSFEAFVEADVFLALRERGWTPWSSVYLDFVPRFMVAAQSSAYAQRLARAIGLSGVKGVGDRISKTSDYLASMWRRGRWHSPLEDFDVETIASIS